MGDPSLPPPSPTLVGAWLHTIIAQAPKEEALSPVEERAKVALYMTLRRKFKDQIKLYRCEWIDTEKNHVMGSQYVMVVGSVWICHDRAAPKGVWGMMRIQQLQKTHQWSVASSLNAQMVRPTELAPPEVDTRFLALAEKLVLLPQK